MVKDITVVDTNYTDYAVVLKHKVFNREYTQVALYGETRVYIISKHVRKQRRHSLRVCLFSFPGRSQTVRNDTIMKFKAFAVSRGFPRDSILTPPPAGTVCGAHGSAHTQIRGRAQRR